MTQKYEIIFYQDKNGYEPVKSYIDDLERQQNKDSKIKHRKIIEYIKILKKYGTMAGEPYIKHIDGEIWELRPIRNRIFFAAWIDDSFVLLHNFIKKTRKTPKSEIEKAKRELKDFQERNSKNDI